VVGVVDWDAARLRFNGGGASGSLCGGAAQQRSRKQGKERLGGLGAPFVGQGKEREGRRGGVAVLGGARVTAGN
jgi:hypothetical protein